MHFGRLPFDTQHCRLHLSTFSQTSSHVRLVPWEDPNDDDVAGVDAHESDDDDFGITDDDAGGGIAADDDDSSDKTKDQIRGWTKCVRAAPCRAARESAEAARATIGGYEARQAARVTPWARGRPHRDCGGAATLVARRRTTLDRYPLDARGWSGAAARPLAGL